MVYLENRSFDNLFRGFEGADTSDHSTKAYTRCHHLTICQMGIRLTIRLQF
ncbi:MAG: hypothetical protein Q8S36_00215 [Sulfuricurvum sp.]|nr:hypothetical protein [Sulfuricurvum sp.]